MRFPTPRRRRTAVLLGCLSRSSRPPAPAWALPSITVPVTTSALANFGTHRAVTITATCASGRLVGGGSYLRNAANPATIPTNGLVLDGTMPSNGSGTAVANGTTNPASWTTVAGYSGQSEAGNQAAAFAMCATSGPANTTVVTATHDRRQRDAGVQRADDHDGDLRGRPPARRRRRRREHAGPGQRRLDRRQRRQPQADGELPVELVRDAGDRRVDEPDVVVGVRLGGHACRDRRDHGIRGLLDRREPAGDHASTAPTARGPTRRRARRSPPRPRAVTRAGHERRLPRRRDGRRDERSAAAAGLPHARLVPGDRRAAARWPTGRRTRTAGRPSCRPAARPSPAAATWTRRRSRCARRKRGLMRAASRHRGWATGARVGLALAAAAGATWVGRGPGRAVHLRRQQRRHERLRIRRGERAARAVEPGLGRRRHGRQRPRGQPRSPLAVRHEQRQPDDAGRRAPVRPLRRRHADAEDARDRRDRRQQRRRRDRHAARWRLAVRRRQRRPRQAVRRRRRRAPQREDPGRRLRLAGQRDRRSRSAPTGNPPTSPAARPARSSSSRSAPTAH